MAMGGWAHLSNSHTIVATEVHLCVFLPSLPSVADIYSLFTPIKLRLAVAVNTQHNKLNLDH